MAVDGGLISQDGGGRVCTQCHMMAPDQSRLTPNVFSGAVVSTILALTTLRGEKKEFPSGKFMKRFAKGP